MFPILYTLCSEANLIEIIKVLKIEFHKIRSEKKIIRKIVIAKRDRRVSSITRQIKKQSFLNRRLISQANFQRHHPQGKMQKPH